MIFFFFFQTCGKQQHTKPQLADSSKSEDEEEKRGRGLKLVDKDSLEQVWETDGEKEEQKDSGFVPPLLTTRPERLFMYNYSYYNAAPIY